jgi:aminoglycoside phosphotransferase (APT) family kinase protein
MPEPIAGDLEETAAQLRGWLSAQLEGASDLDILDLRGPKGTGFSSDTLMFGLRYLQGGVLRQEDRVLRMAPRGDFCVFPEYDVALQFDVMRALETSRVPVPRMLWLEEDPAPLGTPFYIMERIEGVVPSDNPPYHSEGWIYDATPADREKLWYSGLDAMSEIHKLDWRQPEYAFLKCPQTNQTTVQAQLVYWEGFLDWGLERSRYPLINRGFDWLVENQPMEARQGICWGDARLSNQIFHNREVVAVIDWEMIFVGNPTADLAWFITMDRVLTEGLGIGRLEGMPDKRASIARWEENVGFKVDDYDYYEVFASWRFAAIMARIFLQMKHYGILPEEAMADVENLSTPILKSLLKENA